MPSSRFPLPALTWLTNVLKSDLQSLRRQRGGASLAHDAEELLAELAVERTAGQLASPHPQPPPAGPKPARGPVRKAADWPVIFPGPQPVSGVPQTVKSEPENSGF